MKRAVFHVAGGSNQLVFQSWCGMTTSIGTSLDARYWLSSARRATIHIDSDGPTSTVARYGHVADFFHSTCARKRGWRVHVNFHVRTWTTLTCTRRIHVELDVCTWKLTCACQLSRVHIELDVCTWIWSMCTRRVPRVHIYVVDVRTWSEKNNLRHDRNGPP